MMIGTSRLHEPAERAMDDHVFEPALLGAGYFHSAGQAVDVLRVVTSGLPLTEDQSRLFFRRDQTPRNPFDAGVFTAAGLARLRDEWAKAWAETSHVVVEVSSLKNYVLDGLHLQGNPNYYLNAPYKDVWKQGYYAHYLPDLGVSVEDDDVPSLHEAFSALLEACGTRRLTVVPHLVKTGEVGTVRAQLFEAIEEAATGLDINVFDTRPLVDEFGFRVLDDGTTDIHHLPMEGCRKFAHDLAEVRV
ncbi:hypothetical protein ACXR8F_17775 [Terrabacter sp. AAH1]